MLIRVYDDLENFEDFNLVIGNIKDVLSGLKMIKGEEFTNKIINTDYAYVATSNNPQIENLLLNEDNFFLDLTDYDTISIAPLIDGKIPVAIIAVIMEASMDAAMAIGLGSQLGAAIGQGLVLLANTLLVVGAGMALNGIMQALSPTTSFSSDPALAQKKSNLFNGAPIITEQGGSVPLWYGESYAGGVLISSGVSTAEG